MFPSDELPLIVCLWVCPFFCYLQLVLQLVCVSVYVIVREERKIYANLASMRFFQRTVCVGRVCVPQHFAEVPVYFKLQKRFVVFFFAILKFCYKFHNSSFQYRKQSIVCFSISNVVFFIRQKG